MIGANGIWENGIYNMYTSNGKTIYIYADFKEQLKEEPSVVINDTLTLKLKYSREENGIYYYYASHKVSENDGLKDGEMQIKISNYYDLAGNPGKELTNNDIDLDSQKHIIIDKTKPKPSLIGVLNLDNFGTGNVNYAKIGDTVRVRVYFNELLAVEPTITIGGQTYTATLRTGSYSQTYGNAYYADIKLTENMNLSLGKLEFTVSNYQDKAGNVGEIQNQDSTNEKAYMEVIVINDSTVLIDSNADIVNAIKNQQDGQTWLFTKEGKYDVKNSSTIGNYPVPSDVYSNSITFPIYADNITITKAKNVGDVILTSSYVASSWHDHNFITVFGSNVTIDGIDLQGNYGIYSEYYKGINKVLELHGEGKDLTLKNINIIPLTNEDGKFGGSIYFNVEDVGNTTIENVNMDSWISASVVTNGKINIKNLLIDYTNSLYAYSKGYGPGLTGNEEIYNIDGFTIRFDNNVVNMEQIFNSDMKNGTTYELASDIVMDDTLTINKSIVIDGKNHTISGAGITGTTINGFIINNGTVVFKNLTLTDFDENLNAPYGSVIMIDADSTNARVEADNIRINDFIRNAFTFKAGTFKITNSYIDCKPNANREKNLTKAFQIGFSNNYVEGTIENVTIENSSSSYEKWGTSAIEIYNNAEVEIIGGEISNTKNGIWVDHYWAGGTSYPALRGNTKVTIDGTKIDATEYAVILYSRVGAIDSAEVIINNADLKGEVAYVDKTENDSITINNSKINGILSTDYKIKEMTTEDDSDDEEA